MTCYNKILGDFFEEEALIVERLRITLRNTEPLDIRYGGDSIDAKDMFCVVMAVLNQCFTSVTLLRGQMFVHRLTNAHSQIYRAVGRLCPLGLL